jgi:hypothetical protein
LHCSDGPAAGTRPANNGCRLEHLRSERIFARRDRGGDRRRQPSSPTSARRQIARFADDPALPERLFAGRHVAATWSIVTITGLILLTGWARSGRFP